MTLIQHPAYYSAFLDNADEINSALIDGYYKYAADPDIKRSHYFEGRYENIYINKDRIPQLGTILNTAIEHTADILGVDKNTLKAGLWFNAMEPGHVTIAHRHDDDDELLSAVYYVSVPKNSGELILHDKHMRSHVTPAAGMFVFFPPNISHEVTKNNSDQTRLSLGINIGPVNRQED